MAAVTSAGLNLPSLGLLVQDGGRIHEAGSVPQDSATTPELRASPRPTIRASALGSNLMYAPRRSTSSKRVRRGAIGGVLRRRKSVDDMQDLGIRHTTKLHTVEQSVNETLNLGLQAQRSRSVNGELDASIHIAAEDDNLRLQNACDAMAPYLARLKSGSLVLEVGSRVGELTLMVSKRFPELYVQPTEGTGETSPALFVLLQQRLGPEPKREPPRLASPQSTVASPRRHTTLPHAAQTAPQPSSRMLPPRFLDTTATPSWKQKLSANQDIHCVFAVNVVQYLSHARLQRFMQGCWNALKAGGICLMCGPFIDHGEARDSVVVYDGALKVFARAHEEKAGDREKEYGWGCHDTGLIETLGKKIGFEILSVEEVPFTDWLLVVLKRLKYTIPPHLQGELTNIVRPRKVATRYSSGDGPVKGRGIVD